MNPLHLRITQGNTNLYRRYVTLHVIATVAAFSTFAVWIIISAARHAPATAKCESTLFSDPSGSNSAEGKVLCNIFAWIDIGLMISLWIFFAVMQVNLHNCTSFH